jgi:hypothetical protein
MVVFDRFSSARPGFSVKRAVGGGWRRLKLKVEDATEARCHAWSGQVERGRPSPRENTCMTDVSIYVPVISASAAILGAAVSPVTTVYQSYRQAQRERQERHETEARDACTALLRAAAQLRTQVANNHEYHGEEMGARLAQVRKYADDARTHAFNIALLMPRTVAEPAGQVAAAALRLVKTTVENTDLAMGVSVRIPDFDELDGAIADFTNRAVDYTSG